ncbi:ATP-binding protein [Pokkaliibacter sp. CJK22405]|uniref:ATP-binding protein n=1 Tax=Pokkaliibacter sp. CJK22405 TaxID=3384615 RepID=UPI00398482A1
MKRYSLFTFWLLSLIILSGAGTILIYSLSYQSGLHLLEAETHKAFEQHERLATYLFNQHLRSLSKRIQDLSEEESIIDYPDTLSRSRVDVNYYDHYRNDIDLFFVRTPQHLYDLSAPLYATSGFDKALNHMPDNRWRLVTNADASWTALVMSKPIIQPVTGELKGKIIAGIVLNDSFTLIKALTTSMTDKTTAVALISDHNIIISTGDLSRETSDHLSVMDYKLNQVEERPSTMLFTFPLPVDNEADALYLSIQQSSDAIESFRENLKRILVVAIIVILTLSIIIAILASKFSVSPLRKLVSLAQNPQLVEPNFNNPIREFDLLGKLLSQLIQKLKLRESDLLALNEDLEEAKQKAKFLSQQLILLQEQERKNLARELHDELGQCLTAVTADAFLIKGRVSEDDLVRQAAESIYDTSRLMYDTVYNLIRTLRPLPLDELGLIDAMVNIPVLDTLQQKDVQFVLDLPNPDEVDFLNDKSCIAIYRITQEALNNVAKHAEASQVEVTLRVQSKPQRLWLEIIDNGRGFDTLASHNSYGLLGIKERAEGLGGSMSVVSSPGEGTRLVITLPI